jgi:hypothetical protein
MSTTKHRSAFEQILDKVIGPVDNDNDEHAEDAEELEMEPPAKRRRGPGKKKSK